MKIWSFFMWCVCTERVHRISLADAKSSIIPTDSTGPTSYIHVTPTEDESTELVEWLTKYGYLPPPDPSTGQLQAWTAVTHAVRAMQRFAGLNETGVLDEETMALMRAPRCSLPDEGEESSTPSANPLEEGRSLRRKRALSMWTRRNINWRLSSYPSSSSLSRETVRSLVFYALRVWAEPTPLEFHEVAGPEVADLQVNFLRGYHGDGYPFDGPGGAVGHAFFPSDPARAGGVHLDAEEEWTFRQPASEGTDLFTVLVHEFGHALGLSHSSARRSVMRPYYQGPAGDPLHYRLGPHDQEPITQLYGRRNQLLATNAPHLAPEPQLRHKGHRQRHGPSIDRCDTSFDAVAKIRGETFFFKGLTMWRVSSGGLVSSRGASVRRLWGGLPVDLPPLWAVLERHSDHAIIFISGSQFWLFRDLSLQEGYPRPLSDLQEGPGPEAGPGPGGAGAESGAGGHQGLVWDPEEGAVWGEIREGVAIRKEGNQTWSQLIKEGVNGVTTDSDGSICLFKGRSYWRFPFPGSDPAEGYPRLLAPDWLDCPDPSSPSPEDLSLSLSPPTGRQELRDRGRQESGREERWSGERAGRKKGPGHRLSDRDGVPRWPCTCQNGASCRTSAPFLVVVLLLSLWSLITV
ncbi:matrix metalloproteinase-17b [Aplochiton taeniatus]